MESDIGISSLSLLVALLAALVADARSENTTTMTLTGITAVVRNIDACGNTVCRLELGEVCSTQSVCKCPEKQDRRNESDKCAEYFQVTFPLLLARHQPTGRLLYNYSYSDKTNPVYSNLVSRLESGMTNVLQRCTFFPNVIRLSVDRISRPVDVNRTWTESGLWVEFTLRLDPNVTLDQAEAYDKIFGVITSEFDYRIGGIDLLADRYQPPIQCFNNNCPKDGLCIPARDRFTCKCQVGCRDLDPAKAGRVCSCPCSSLDSYSCPDFSDCIPYNNPAGYTCKCKTGFIDISSNGQNQDTINGSSPHCVMDYCLQRQSDCERKNATCIRHESGHQCQCIDGYVDVRKDDSKLQASTGAICLKSVDVNECHFQMHSCLPPATCIKSKPLGYQCQCPDGSPVAPDSMCSVQSRASCSFCKQQGTCAASSDNSTTVCECDDGYSGADCSVKIRLPRLAQIWSIGGVEIEWTWVPFGIGAGLGVLLCVLLFTIIKVIQRQCRKKPTVRPSMDDEVFNFHEVTRNVYGVGGINVRKDSKVTGPVRASSRTSLSEATTQSQINNNETPSPYAVSEVGYSTFKRNATQT